MNTGQETPRKRSKLSLILWTVGFSIFAIYACQDTTHTTAKTTALAKEPVETQAQKETREREQATRDKQREADLAARRASAEKMLGKNKKWDDACVQFGQLVRKKSTTQDQAEALSWLVMEHGLSYRTEDDLIKKRQIGIDISRCTALASWGRPTRINRTVSSNHVREQWVYDRSYLYFIDDRLTSYQD